jgi:hypothetical protein
MRLVLVLKSTTVLELDTIEPLFIELKLVWLLSLLVIFSKTHHNPFETYHWLL